MWGIAKGAGQIVRMSFHVLQESFICTWMRRFTEICDSPAVGRKRFGSDRVAEASIMRWGRSCKYKDGLARPFDIGVLKAEKHRIEEKRPSASYRYPVFGCRSWPFEDVV